MFTELYREEKREEGDRSGQEDKGGNPLSSSFLLPPLSSFLLRRETDPASNQFPKCSPQSRTHKEIQSWVEKRRGREEMEATWWRKRRIQMRRMQLSQ